MSTVKVSAASAVAVLGILVGSARAQQAVAPAPMSEKTVWQGVYTKAQAQRGALAYQEHCSSCHRPDLKGQADAPALIGAPFFDRWSDLSVQDLYFAIQITMSHSDDLFVPSDTAADIVSFVLRANHIPAGTRPLPLSDEELRQILITQR